MTGSLDDFATRYFRDLTALSSGTRPERLALEQAVDRPAFRLDELLESPADAENAWQMILELIDRAPDDPALSFVAAGPLEDLIRRHGAQFGERLAERANQDERFRDALRDVWGWDEVPEPHRATLRGLIERTP